MRQRSPSLGGSDRESLLASDSIPFQGRAIPTDQPRSRSSSLFTVPSTKTAVRLPGKVQSNEPRRGPRGWVVKPTPLNVLRRDRSSPGALAKPPVSYASVQTKNASYEVLKALSSNS